VHGYSVPKGIDGSSGLFTKPSFEFGEDLLDRIKVRVVGRQQQAGGSGSLDGLTYALDFVGRRIIDDDHVTGFERWHKNLLDVGQKTFAIDWAVEDRRSSHLIASQSRDKCRRFPMTVWRITV
jgi:hypothetical protein